MDYMDFMDLLRLRGLTRATSGTGAGEIGKIGKAMGNLSVLHFFSRNERRRPSRQPIFFLTIFNVVVYFKYGRIVRNRTARITSSGNNKNKSIKFQLRLSLLLTTRRQIGRINGLSELGSSPLIYMPIDCNRRR